MNKIFNSHLPPVVPNYSPNALTKFETDLKSEIDLLERMEKFRPNKIDLLKHLWDNYFWPAIFQDKKISVVELSCPDFVDINNQFPDDKREQFIHTGTLWGAVVKLNMTLKKGIMLVLVEQAENKNVENKSAEDYQKIFEEAQYDKDFKIFTRDSSMPKQVEINKETK